MTQALEHYQPENALANAESWDLGTEGKRGRAKLAAHNLDPIELFGLVVAYLTTETDKGTAISVNTLEAYRRSVGLLIDWASERGKNLLRLTHADGGLFREWLGEHGLAPASVNLRLAGAKAMLRALVWAEALSVNPWSDVKRRRNATRPEDQRDHYTRDELRAMIGAAKDDRERALVYLGAESGLRISEMAGAQWSAIDWATGELVVTGKGSKTASVPLGPGGIAALRALQPDAVSDYIFEAGTCPVGRPRKREDSHLGVSRVRAIVNGLAKRAGVTPRGVHSLRHSCGTFALQACGNLAVVAEILRHADPSTTKRYAKVSAEDKRAVVSRLGEACWGTAAAAS